MLPAIRRIGVKTFFARALLLPFKNEIRCGHVPDDAFGLGVYRDVCAQSAWNKKRMLLESARTMCSDALETIQITSASCAGTLHRAKNQGIRINPPDKDQVWFYWDKKEKEIGILLNLFSVCKICRPLFLFNQFNSLFTLWSCYPWIQIFFGYTHSIVAGDWVSNRNQKNGVLSTKIENLDW